MNKQTELMAPNTAPVVIAAVYLSQCKRQMRRTTGAGGCGGRGERKLQEWMRRRCNCGIAHKLKSGHIVFFRLGVSLSHRAKKNVPTAAQKMNTNVMLTHHARRVSVF